MANDAASDGPSVLIAKPDGPDETSGIHTALLEQARVQLQAGNAAGCLASAGGVLAVSPDEDEAIYLQAVALRYLNRLAEAEASVDRLLDLKPGYGRAWQELGHVHRAARRISPAIAAYEAAVRTNPALIASWRQLAALHRAAGNPETSARADGEAQWLASLPRELLSVESFIAEGRLQKAEALCRAFLTVNPEHVEAMRQLAAIGSAMNVLDDAEYLLESAHAFAPDHVRIHSEYAAVLHRRQKFTHAQREAEALFARSSDDPAVLTLLGNARMGMGDYEGAITAYDAVLTAWPRADSVHLSRGHALKTIGRRDEAVAAYRAAYVARPDFGDAYWSLANLKTYRFTEAEIGEMTHWETMPRTTQTDRIHLNFALGKAYEDAGDHARSFTHYERGNALKLADSGYDPARFDEEVERMIAYTPAALFAGNAAGGAPASDPIFVVGLPRAGSTLIEQILASHSMVEGTAELPQVLAQVHALSARTIEERDRFYPASLATLTPDDFTRMGESYLAETQALRHGKPRFVDKMPNNFRHIGLIARMLPRARIIDARREPMACCFSGFKQLFAEGQEFTYGLEAIGRYYRGYLRLMDHWQTVLPERILTVRHEDLLDDFEAEVRRMLAFLDLPFEPACLDFHRTERAVRTASSEQVRRPLNNEGREVWRNFAAYLSPLARAIGHEAFDTHEVPAS